MDRLVERVDKLREEIAMYEAQTTAQNEETRVTKDALSEAYMEMEVRYFSVYLGSSHLILVGGSRKFGQ